MARIVGEWVLMQRTALAAVAHPLVYNLSNFGRKLGIRKMIFLDCGISSGYVIRCKPRQGRRTLTSQMEALGPKLRRQRRRLGLTLDELAGRTGISKPYLSLIETGRVPNPPSDEKLRRLEQTLGFPTNELVTQAHLHRTPRDVRAVLTKLLRNQSDEATKRRSDEGVRVLASESSPSVASTIDLDDAYVTGVLHDLVEKSAGNVDQVTTNAVPVINRVAAGYPSDFTDLNYPRGVADNYVGCPDIQDKDAFAARVHGDSMSPKYREGDIVIFSPGAAPRSGDDCFVRFEDGHTTFKRVFFENDDAGRAVLRLQPRNEKYRAQVIPSQSVSGLYKALFKYQRVDED
jgi:phage repressor protein C with HTH and peptisase S24 domain/DNA-binding XRE family transcriptional regulator